MPTGRLIFVMCAALVLNQTGFMTLAAVLPQAIAEWRLSGSEAGWINGIFFGAYAGAVPLLASLTDRIDPRRVYLAASLLGAAAGFAFFAFAEGFWSALLLRAVAGVALAGCYMPGLKLLSDRLDGAAQARGAAVYTSVFALGGAWSFLAAGLLAAQLGWRWAFFGVGMGGLAAFALALLAPATPRPAGAAAGWVPDLRPVLRVAELRRYFVAAAGHTWEIFAVRSWFVAFLGFNVGLAGNGGFAGWNLPLLGALGSLLAVPASIAIAEAAQRYGRRRAIVATTLASVAVALAIAANVAAWFPLLLLLALLHSATAFGDNGTLASGVVASAEPQRRGTALAAYSLFGFTGGFLGPLAVGLVIDLAGGTAEPRAWSAAFVVIALGSALGTAAFGLGRRPAAVTRPAPTRPAPTR